VKSAATLAFLCLLSAGPAGAATWTVDPTRSSLSFQGVQTGSPFQGKFDKFTAQIEFDPSKPEAGHVVVLIDMASAHTGDTQRDESLPQNDWFDVKSNPQARFEATGFRAKGGDNYEAAGRLTIRGIGRDCVLPFTLDISGDTAHAKGHVQILRTDFSIGQGPWASGQWVALQVGVDFDLTAKRAL
jgi:polyisoprenoid-binding protein YceI